MLRNKSAVLVVLGLLGAGAAYAQSQTTPPQGVSVTAGVAAPTNLTPAELSAKADQMVAGMGVVRQSVQRKLGDARASNDIVKTECLDPILTEVDKAKEDGEKRARALASAAKRDDRDQANHEFQVLLPLSQKVTTLDGDANQCIGKNESAALGSDEVRVEVDSNLPDPFDRDDQTPTVLAPAPGEPGTVLPPSPNTPAKNQPSSNQ